MGVGSSADEIDDYEEHWGESAYVVALGWASTGRTNSELRMAADALVAEGIGPLGVTASELIDAARALVNEATRKPAKR